MLKISQYPKNTDGSPMNLDVGVLVDDTGNGGARLQQQPVGPDGMPIDARGLVLVDPTGALVPISAMNMVGAATRASLASITIASLAAGASRYLVETGRKGVFVWNPANLSALVTADPLQGVLVAPTNDPTGASGAWVRHVEGYHNVKWWGAVGDDVTDDGPAFLAALVYLKAIRITSSAVIYNEGTATLFVPRSKYYLNASTLDLTVGLYILGESLGELGGEASQLRWTVNTPGIRVQRGNTTGDTGANAGNVSLNGGDGSIIEKLALVGPGGANAEYNAILLRARATIRDCYIINWQGDGVKILATSGGGVGSEGNANNWEVTRCAVQGCRNGLFVDGSDANAGKATLVNAINNRQWGIWDSSFLGNTYDACHASGNTLGAYKTDNNNARNVFTGCYSESGQPTSSFVYPTLVLGGSHAAGIDTTAFGGYLSAFGQELIAAKDLKVNNFVLARGATHEFGPQDGAASDVNAYLDNTNSNSVLNFRRWAAGVSTVDGSVSGANATGGLQINGRTTTYMLIGGGVVGYWDAAGIHVTGVGSFTGAVSASNLSGTNTGDETSATVVAKLSAFTGDVTKALGGTALTIAANAVTYAKFQQVAANSLVGNPTGALANAQGITLAGGLAFSGTTITVGALTPTSVAATGVLTSSGGGVGYATGAGGTVAQATSRATGVTLNKLCGNITLFNTTTAAGQFDKFTLTNSQIAANDVVNVCVKTATANYIVCVLSVAAGSCVIGVYTPAAVGAAEAPVINFTVSKAVNA